MGAPGHNRTCSAERWGRRRPRPAVSAAPDHRQHLLRRDAQPVILPRDDPRGAHPHQHAVRAQRSDHSEVGGGARFRMSDVKIVGSRRPRRSPGGRRPGQTDHRRPVHADGRRRAGTRAHDAGGRAHPIDRVLHDGDTVSLGGTTLVARRRRAHARLHNVDVERRRGRPHLHRCHRR